MSKLAPGSQGFRHMMRTFAALGVAAVAVVVARWAWTTTAVTQFVAQYPGVVAGAQWEGTPGWVGALHAANIFLMFTSIRSGLLLHHTGRATWYWTRSTRTGQIRMPVEEWFHVVLDVIWLLTGAVFVVLMFVTGRWVRLVPTTWDVFPQAASVLLQYASLHWPTEQGWVTYNALQMLAYGSVVFILAPLAALTGLRLSSLWPNIPAVNRVLTLGWAKKAHYPVMVLFLIFIMLHVVMVLGTGAVHNLNHMFGGRDDDSLVGVLVALAVLGLSVGGWLAVRPAVLRPLAALTGKVTR